MLFTGSRSWISFGRTRVTLFGDGALTWSPPIGRLRLARVESAQGKHDAAIVTLNGAQAGKFEARFAEARGDILFAKGDNAGALQAYQQALSTGEEGVVDLELLDLKIRDLGGTPLVKEQVASQSPTADVVP